MSHARLWASAAFLTLSACNLAPAYHTPPVAVPLAYKEVPPWEPAQPADDLNRGAWWERFGDDTLNGLEPLVDAANPDLAATVARYDEARAYAVEAAAGLYPQINGDAVLTANRQSVNRPLRVNEKQPNYYNAAELAASLNYEVDLWGKLRNEAAAGRATAQASAADLASMRLSLQAELASDYLALRGADAQDQLLTDTVAAYQKALDLTEHRFEGKIASSLDVSQAQTQLQTAQAAVANATAARALLEHAIATLVGKPASDFSIPPKLVAVTMPDIPTGAPSALLQRRPDIASAERVANAANSGVGVARAAFYPSLSLNLVGGFQATSLSLLNLPDSFWTVGPTLTIPVFEGGRLKAGESAAYAILREAGANYRSAVLSAFQQVEDQGALLRLLADASAHEEAGVTSAQHSLDVALNLYRLGVTSYLEVVTAQTALLQAQQQALDFRTRRHLATVGLIRALGGGWDVKDLPSDSEATRLAANHFR
jgi:NodT family efflux transporter outer membrane factor (OMF) lipoprotein